MKVPASPITSSGPSTPSSASTYQALDPFPGVLDSLLLNLGTYNQMDEGSCLSDLKLRALNTLFSEHKSSMRSLSGDLGFVAMLLNLGIYCQMDEVANGCTSLPSTASTRQMEDFHRCLNKCGTMKLINEVPPINVDGRIAAC
ncbi:hypothetical protein IHE45_16G007400 [Dioscorea alata]|uniref:Uncharacterized protein n=1 Tax=Dioscorea alata TaxID=55571 RepID=A0ACB7UFM0_DIOAL|nr:hypothetical protein IHE45_16G007400 [Dioscorea alata]